MKTSALGERMKRYEAVTNTSLTRRMPVILRFDQVAGHTFTKGMVKPWDEVYCEAMEKTMQALAANIQGCVFGYTQSDEITLVLVDYQTLTTEAWFDYRVSKMCSVGASMCALYFNKFYLEALQSRWDTMSPEDYAKYERKTFTANFDCRAFNIPKEDVCNCIIWRQKDATRNSILGLAQTLFSHKEMQGISCSQLQDKMFTEKGVNWNDIETKKKRGCACYKDEDGWIFDTEMPILTENREYVERLILVGD